MLSLAREAIGSVRPYQISTEIHSYKVVKVDQKMLAFADTMALSCLANILIDASYYLGHRMKKTKNVGIDHNRTTSCKEAYAFMSGTGLDVLIDYYEMDLDPETLREKFCALFQANTAS